MGKSPKMSANEKLRYDRLQFYTEDIEKMSFNTAISRMMEFCNEMTPLDVRPRAAIEPFVLLLSPFAPHIAEELWHRLGHDGLLVRGPFPEADPALLVEDTIEIPVQVKGKVRSRIQVPADADETTLREAALADDKIAALLDGEPRKVIIVPGRLVNIVP